MSASMIWPILRAVTLRSHGCCGWVLSHDDRMVDVWRKADELVQDGVSYVWIIDPDTLKSELKTPAGVEAVANKTLRIPDSPIVIPL
jgi:hypothetical protein